MPKYSILMRLNGPAQLRLAMIEPSLQATIDSVLQQTTLDWELILLGTQPQLATVGVPTDPRIRLELAPAEEGLPWGINRLQPSLGQWVGTIGIGDRLTSDALTQLDLAMVVSPGARVVFSDEESCNWFGQVSMRFNKGAVNPLRLRHQEYLRDFTVIDRITLAALGGFNRMTSTCPQHDLYLRVLETFGSVAFLNVPHRLYQRFRDHRDGLPRVSHDLQAVQDQLERLALPAQVRQLNGRVHIDYRFEQHPWVTVVVVVHDDIAVGLQRIHCSQLGPQYRPATFQVLHVGSNPAARLEYEGLCSTLRLSYLQTHQPLVAALNQHARRVDTQLLLFLQGEAIQPRWLHQLVDHSRAPDTGAVGPRCFAGSRLHQPGVLGHTYDGWDWNSAGRFDVLNVPHQIAAVSPACLLIDTRRFLQLGGFDPSYPTLYGMELCLRLDEADFANVMVPSSHVEVRESAVPVTEAEQLRLAWPGWRDRFGLHLPLQQ